MVWCVRRGRVLVSAVGLMSKAIEDRVPILIPLELHVKWRDMMGIATPKTDPKKTKIKAHFGRALKELKIMPDLFKDVHNRWLVTLPSGEEGKMARLAFYAKNRYRHGTLTLTQKI